MGNKQSRTEFKNVLPSDSNTKVHAFSESSTISNTWSTGQDASVNHLVADSEVKIPDLAIVASHVQAARSLNVAQENFLIPESVRQSQTLATYLNRCSEILPGFLYVSNVYVAQETAKLRALGITHIINCCAELKLNNSPVDPLKTVNGDEIDTLNLKLRDDAREELTPFLPRVMGFIASLRQGMHGPTQKREKVLLHCHQGISRSCALAIAYVMLEQQLSYQAAFTMVKEKRAIANPNAAFICQLLEWEKELQAMRLCEDGSRLYGLYRLTRHAEYDPECFVLKLCYQAKGGQTRSNRVILTTFEEERCFLWSQGTFVYPNPRDCNELIIWRGSKCSIFEAIPKATELAHQLLRISSLAQSFSAVSMPMQITEVIESVEGCMGSDIDHFGYGNELAWSPTVEPQTPRLSLLSLEEKPSTDPETVYQLFLMKDPSDQDSSDTWEEVRNYDSEDLTSENVLLLVLKKSRTSVDGYVWIGMEFLKEVTHVVEAAQKQVQSLVFVQDSLPVLRVERQGNESDEFWEHFEAGY